MRVAKPTGKVYFKETQRFRQTWLWLILVASALISFMPVFLVAIDPKKNDPAGMITLLFVVMLVTVANFAGFYFTRLDTVITSDGIFLRWWPFFKSYRFYHRSEISSISLLTYTASKFGFHRNSKLGRVHNVNGKHGISFIAGGNESVYIGSQKIAAMRLVFEQHLNKVYQ